MTKLFSMKSLAFAGAAAFALTLAAAPQADAAETTAATKIETLDVDVDGWVYLSTDGDLTETDDGSVIYYQVAKSSDKIKENKYTAITTNNYEMGNAYYYNFDKYIGTQNYISFSLDGVKETTGVALKAQPKLKVKYSAKDGLTFAVNGNTYVKTATQTAIQYYTHSEYNGSTGETKFITEAYEYEVAYVTGGDGKKYRIQGVGNEQPSYHNGIKDEDFDGFGWYYNFGGTLYYRVIELDSTDGVAVYSKEAKVKIPARAKAPKVSLKLDAAKEFTWKIAKKLEFKVKVGDASSEWTPGSNSADTWTQIITSTKTDKFDQTGIVSGDAITADISISVRTAATEKKTASALTVVNLTKSAPSPTGSAVTVTTAKPSGKTATSAAIKAGSEDVQYSIDAGKKWKTLKAGNSVTLKKDTEKSVLVRIPGQSKNATVLPSLNTKVDIDFASGKATVTSIDYDGDSFKTAVEEVEAK
jgi:hypothetical protein